MSSSMVVVCDVVFVGVLSVVTEIANAQQTHRSAKILSREGIDVYQTSLTNLAAHLFLFHFDSARAATIVVRTMQGSHVSEIFSRVKHCLEMNLMGSCCPPCCRW